MATKWLHCTINRSDTIISMMAVMSKVVTQGTEAPCVIRGVQRLFSIWIHYPDPFIGEQFGSNHKRGWSANRK